MACGQTQRLLSLSSLLAAAPLRLVDSRVAASPRLGPGGTSNDFEPIRRIDHAVVADLDDCR